MTVDISCLTWMLLEFEQLLHTYTRILRLLIDVGKQIQRWDMMSVKGHYQGFVGSSYEDDGPQLQLRAPMHNSTE